MTVTNMTNLQKNLVEYINQAIEFSDVISVSTNSGNAVIMSEGEYRGLLETLYISSIPNLKQSILDSMNEPIEDMVDADLLEW